MLLILESRNKVVWSNHRNQMFNKIPAVESKMGIELGGGGSHVSDLRGWQLSDTT